MVSVNNLEVAIDVHPSTTAFTRPYQHLSLPHLEGASLHCLPCPPSAARDAYVSPQNTSSMDPGLAIIAASVAFFVVGSYSIFFSAFLPLTGISVRASTHSMPAR